MKNFTITILLIIFSGVIAISNIPRQDNKIIFSNDDNNKDISEVSNISEDFHIKYSFDIDLSFQERRVVVHQKINLNANERESLYLSLPVNAFEHNQTAYNAGKEINERTYSYYNFKSVKLNGENTRLKFIEHKIFKEDRTLALIELPKVNIDEIDLTLSYVINLPVNADMFGFSKGNNLCLLTDWYPYVITDSTQAFHRTNLFLPVAADASIEAEISYPEGITVVSSGEKIKNSSTDKIKFEQNDGNKISLFFLNEVNETHYTVVGEKKSIDVQLLMLHQSDGYTERIQTLIKNSITYLQENLAPYPFDKLKVLNVPNTENFGFESFGRVATVYCDLISPLNTLNPEYDLCRNIVKQYFYQIKLNQQYDRWVMEGLVTFIASKILDEYYERPNVYFHFAGYYPIYGLIFLSYNSIPIIYTLNNYKYGAVTKNVSSLYANKNLNPVFENDIMNLSITDFKASFDIRMAIVLQSFSDEIGIENLISEICRTYMMKTYPISFSHSFLDNLTDAVGEDAKEFLKSNLQENRIYDYSIDSITKLTNNTYAIEVSNKGNSIAPIELIAYTKLDSILTQWDGEINKKVFIVNSPIEITSAKIKLKYAEVMDFNKANNSFIIEPNYLGPFAMSLRTFFWFQNALMIFGSIG